MNIIDLCALFVGLFAIWGMLYQFTTREMDQRQKYYEEQLQKSDKIMEARQKYYDEQLKEIRKNKKD